MSCRSLYSEWSANNGEVTMPDGTRHRVDRLIVGIFDTILETTDRQVPHNNTVDMLLGDINSHKSIIVDLQAKLDDQRQHDQLRQAATGVAPQSTLSLLSSLTSLPFTPLAQSTPNQPPPPAPLTHALSPIAGPSGLHHHPSPPRASSPVLNRHSSSRPRHAPYPVAGPSGLPRVGRQTRTAPQTDQGRQTRTASRTDQRIATQTSLPRRTRAAPTPTELWQEPLRPDWGRNGTASDVVRTGVQNANVAPLAMGPHRRCQNCHCELSSAPSPVLLCNLCGCYADRMVSLSQCYLFRLLNHA